MTLPLLYSFRRCPYAIRARYALASAGVQCRVHEVKLSDKPPALLVLSPKGTVPVLQLASGEVIDESLAIIDYAFSQNDPMGMQLCTAEEKSAFDQWIGPWQTRWVAAINLYKYADRYPDRNKNDAHDVLLELLGLVDQSLRECGGFLLRSRPSVTDLALFPLIRQFAIIDWDHFCGLGMSSLVVWLQSFLESDIFLQVMKKSGSG